MDKNKYIYIFGICIAIIINIFSWNLPFFWDTILTSTITQHFYENGFDNLITPAQYDAGHPPLFYIYVTTFYHLFGRNLVAAHGSILPFSIIGIVSFISILKKYNFRLKQQYLAVVLYFSIPAVITQNILVSYDAVLLSLYLASIASYFKNKKILFAFILIVMVGISLRSLFCIVSLSMSIFFLSKKEKNNWVKWNLYLLPSILFIVIWYGYHYTQTGWFISTNASGWSQQRGIVDGIGLFKNLISITRCFVDLGVVVLSFLCCFYLIQKRKIDQLILVAIFPAIVFAISFLPFTNPINHRYFLIVYVLMIPIVMRFLSYQKNIITVITISLLWFGNLQLYPVPISNGWDCTLAHISYFKCINDFNKKCVKVLMDKNKNIGTVFPMHASAYQTKMELDTTKKINIHNSSIDSIDYIIFSSVGNDFSDNQIKELKNWIVLYSTKHTFVELILYKNPNKSFK